MAESARFSFSAGSATNKNILGAIRNGTDVARADRG